MKNQIKPRELFKANDSNLILTLMNGARIQFKSAEKPDNLFGDDVYAAVFDEFTRAREEAWFALRSTLTATNGKCKLIGNAKGKKNWGYKLGVRAKNGETGYQYFRITAWDAVDAGILKREEVEQAMTDLPEIVFKELYLAEPSEDKSNPFGISAIRECIKPISTLDPVCFGVDLAKYSDWTVIIGLDKNGDICYFDRWRGDWDSTKKKLIKIIARTPAHIDSTGVGDPIVEDIARVCHQAIGINYAAGNKTKQQLMEGLAGAISGRVISVIEGVLHDELEAFEFEYSNGRVKFSAPDGCHDDCVNSLALAWDCKNKNPKPAWTVL
jgi:phage FluMu gp28-like protein